MIGFVSKADMINDEKHVLERYAPFVIPSQFIIGWNTFDSGMVNEPNSFHRLYLRTALDTV